MLQCSLLDIFNQESHNFALELIFKKILTKILPKIANVELFLINYSFQIKHISK